jgi:phospholipase D1/2
MMNLIPEGEPGHGNIRLMRHPDHNVLENAGDMTFYWVILHGWQAFPDNY